MATSRTEQQDEDAAAGRPQAAQEAFATAGPVLLQDGAAGRGSRIVLMACITCWCRAVSGSAGAG